MKILPLLLGLCAVAAADDALLTRVREVQRGEGYGAALRMLEEHLDDWRAADTYARLCAWGGEEERGIDVLERCALPENVRRWARSDLFLAMGRFQEAADEGRRAGKDSAWVEWARQQAALRERLRARGVRAIRVSAAALLLLLAGAVTLWRRAPGA
ncbi:MAG: hypothetical protein ACT4PV_04785 [Planctomycetaceae bacterium]